MAYLNKIPTFLLITISCAMSHLPVEAGQICSGIFSNTTAIDLNVQSLNNLVRSKQSISVQYEDEEIEFLKFYNSAFRTDSTTQESSTGIVVGFDDEFLYLKQPPITISKESLLSSLRKYTTKDWLLSPSDVGPSVDVDWNDSKVGSMLQVTYVNRDLGGDAGPVTMSRSRFNTIKGIAPVHPLTNGLTTGYFFKETAAGKLVKITKSSLVIQAMKPIKIPLSKISSIQYQE